MHLISLGDFDHESIKRPQPSSSSLNTVTQSLYSQLYQDGLVLYSHLSGSTSGCRKVCIYLRALNGELLWAYSRYKKSCRWKGQCPGCGTLLVSNWGVLGLEKSSCTDMGL